MIGERLLDLRKDAKLTQNDLSKILHINKHSISSYEREKSEPPDGVKIAIAKYFAVSVDYLLGLTDNPNPYEEQRNYIRLPAKFPEKAVKELKEYASYLMNKYNK